MFTIRFHYGQRWCCELHRRGKHIEVTDTDRLRKCGLSLWCGCHAQKNGAVFWCLGGRCYAGARSPGARGCRRTWSKTWRSLRDSEMPFPDHLVFLGCQWPHWGWLVWGVGFWGVSGGSVAPEGGDARKSSGEGFSGTVAVNLWWELCNCTRCISSMRVLVKGGVSTPPVEPDVMFGISTPFGAVSLASDSVAS